MSSLLSQYSFDLRKIGISTKCLYVCNPLCTTGTFLPTNIGVRLWAGVSTTDKTFGPFSEWDFSPKKTFPRRVFSSLNVHKENPVEILPTYAIAHSPIVHYIRYIN